MSYSGYECLKIRSNQGVAFVTIDHPPINLFDMALILEVDRVGRELEADTEIRAVVVDSADPDFFIAHADVELILAASEEAQDTPREPSFFQQMVDRFRTMPKATIALIEGICRGGVASSCSPWTCASRRWAMRRSPSQRWRWASFRGAAGPSGSLV